jgi:hypothetical protein
MKEENFMSNQDRSKTVGFIGLGDMGGPMTANLLKAGILLVVHDLDRSKVDKAVAQGAIAAHNPKEVLSLAEIGDFNGGHHSSGGGSDHRPGRFNRRRSARRSRMIQYEHH